MCGVLVIFSKKKKLNKKKCLLSFDAIKNRGPDLWLSNYFLEDKLFIGNSVLKVTGKFETKKLASCENERFYISYNGEIYNYKSLKGLNNYLIKSTNDTSKLIKLHKYNSAFNIVKSLDGMFAYVVYDNKDKKLYFASDTQGEKKLFKFEDKNFLILSSNISAILKFFVNNKLDIDSKQIINYLKTRHFLTIKNTIYKKIKLLSGAYLFTKDLRSGKFTKKRFQNPLDWIDEEYYKKLKKNDEKENLVLLDNLLKKYSKLLKPAIKFGSVFTGGIDSSLQASYFFKDKNLKKLVCIDHLKKDKITNNIKQFEKYTKKEIVKISCNEKKYYSKLSTIYKSLCFPLPSHDVVGHQMVYNYFKSQKIKVSFGASGADELFGGYDAYKYIDWHSKINKNLSPYSSFAVDNSNRNSEDRQSSNKLWSKAFKKYSKFLNNTEAKMQATLFTDYFVQGITKDNIVIDIISMSNGIEARNIFLNKNIITFCLNLPIKYKINLNERNDLMVCKPLLKKLFIRKFNKNLVFKKQGFSGFPNESIKFASKNDKTKFKKISNLLNSVSKEKKNLKAKEWKFLNLFYFSKFLKRNINFKKYAKFI